jgi:anti-sigma factor RsiW
MMETNEKHSPEEIEALLPWHAAGTLSSHEADAVEQALATNEELARRFALVREEMAETILLNEALGAPSARAMEKLFAAIDNERKSVRSPAGRGFGAWLSELFTPRVLAFSAAAAALVILLQAGIIAKMALENSPDSEGTFETASAPTTREAGSYVLVRFAPQANLADVTRLLDSRNAVIVDGPRPAGPGGMYRVQIAPTRLAVDELDRAIKEFQSAAGTLVSFVAPTE